MRKVAFDVRVSTEHEAQMNALQNQKQWVLDLAKQHAGDWIFDKERDLYIEEGLSGTSLKKRPAFNLMLQRALKGEYDLM